MKAKTIIVLLLVLLIIAFLIMKYAPLQHQELCKENVGYSSKDMCYCPTNEIMPTGVPKAQWVKVGDFWQCMYLY